jgi:hypothetical protein
MSGLGLPPAQKFFAPLRLYRRRSGKVNTDTKSFSSAAATLSFSSIARHHHHSRLSTLLLKVPLLLPLPAAAACRHDRLSSPLGLVLCPLELLHLQYHLSIW